MSDTHRPLLSELSEELSGIVDEASQLAALRWRLVEIELRESLQVGRRFALGAVAAMTVVLTSLPVLVIAASGWLDRVVPLRGLSWTWVLGLLLLLGGSAGLWFSWRRFRGDFRGLEQSIEELREDLVWLQERRGGTD